MSKLKTILKFTSLLAIFIFIAYSWFFSSTSEIHRRVRYYFGISPLSQITPESIQLEIIKNLPVGSSKDEIYSFIENSQLGKDRVSVCNPPNRSDNYNQNVTCYIDTNIRMIDLDLRRVSYEVIFKVNSQGKLYDVRVRELAITL